jgi:aminopeptidase N
MTISNGELLGTKDEPDGMKTWDWKQSQPLSTYLISAVAGEFVEKKDTWRGMPLRFVVPRGDESKIDSTFVNTKQMLDTFSDHLDVRYPWAQYAQTSVNDFIVGGMEKYQRNHADHSRACRSSACRRNSLRLGQS